MFRNFVTGFIYLILLLNPVPLASESEDSSLSQLLSNADSTFNARRYEESRGIYRQIAARAEISGDSSILAEAYAMIARSFLITGQKDVGREWLKKAGGAAKINEPLGWSRYLGVLGRFEWQDKNDKKAAETFKEMYLYCSEKKLHDRAVDAAHMVAITGSAEEQTEWGLRGIAEAEAGGLTNWLGPLWNNLAATYEDMGEFNKSLEAYLKAREFHLKYGDEKNKMIADWAVGHAYRLVGDLNNAENLMKPVLDWCKRLNDTEFIGWSFKELGEIESLKENHQKAIEYFDQAAIYLKQAEMPSWDPDGYQKLLDKIQSANSKLPVRSN